MLLSKSSSSSLLLNSQKAHYILACLIQMDLQYLLLVLVFPIQPYSQIEYRYAKPKEIPQLKKLKTSPVFSPINVPIMF